MTEITCLGSLSLGSSWNGWAGTERENFALLPCLLSQCFSQHTFAPQDVSWAFTGCSPSKYANTFSPEGECCQEWGILSQDRHCAGPCQFSSVLFSGSVMSNSSQPNGLQHARLPCPSPTSRVYSNSCPLSRWCHPNVSSSAIPFSSLQSFPASGSCQMSQFFPSGGQNIGVSASASVLPMNIQDWFPSGWTGWISLESKGLLQHHSSKTSIVQHSASFIVQISDPYMTTGKTIALTRWTFVGKVMSLLFNMLSRLVIAFLPRSKRPLISWVQSQSAMILELKNIKSVTVSTVSPIYLPWSDGTRYHHRSFLNVELQASFITLFFHPHQEAL